MHVKHVSNVTFHHLSNRYLSIVMKISEKINTMQNMNFLYFCSLTVLNNLKGFADIVDFNSWMVYFVATLSTSARLLMFYSILLYCVFVCNHDAMKWPFAFNK